MVELNTWAGLEPAVMDIKTVSGLAQVFELTLTDSTGSVADLEGVTFRGAVNTAPLQELMCAVEGGKVLFGWSGLPAGRHSFDLFLVTGHVEKALVRGAFVVSGRVMPPLDQESYSVNHAATLVLPDTADGIILVELSEVGLVDLLSRKAGAFAEEARGHVSSVRELKEFIVQKVDGFGDVVDTATTAITEARKSAVASVESGREEAVQAVKEAKETATTAITEARKSAVASVESGREEAVQAVKEAKETATTAITEAGKSAVASVESDREEAVQAVKEAKETATTAITEAGKSAVESVESSRRAAVGAITPLVQEVETVKGAIDQAENRINAVGTDAENSATSAANSATAAANALAAMPQVDASGNMTLAGSFSATGGIFNGKLVVNNPNGSMGDGSYNQIYGLTWFYGQVEFRKGGILRGDLWVESGTVRIGANAAFNCSGSGTFAGTVNANGGINIPLAVGAPTDTSAVNRLYAAGMGGVTGILTSNAFLNTDAITASGSSTVTKTVPYHLAGIKVPKGTHSTIQARFEVSNPQWNYSSFAGFSFLWRATNAAKLSFGIGRGGKTIRPDLSIDSYSIIPANGLAYNHGEILDITFDNVRDTQRNGYIIKVREIYALTAAAGWQVKTTTSFIPASQNEPVPWTIAKVIYQQKSVANIAKYENTGALWLMLTGGQGNNLYQIATCRGVSNFETNVGVTQWVADVVNNTAGYVSVYAGTGEYTYYQPGGMNPVFYSLEAMAVNVIETEETADFVDVNTPLES
ncbi:ATP synthase F0 subunit B [Akkermansia muciniphila]|uniref:ATP synthase F0 subunit B n=1 Tax=Akkermansia muciniphila TaxID=239935 RepID=UPI00201DCF60|nr:ATP synthase F0 subunit B [Akkermansia muciniphila]MCL6680262.1 ATP synthase F0 subunit B [Akkermansia muciniphila]